MFNASHLPLFDSAGQTSDNILGFTTLHCPVFLINSPPFLLLLPSTFINGAPSPEVTVPICRVPSTSFIRSS